MDSERDPIGSNGRVALPWLSPRPKFQDRVFRHVLLLLFTVVTTTWSGLGHYLSYASELGALDIDITAATVLHGLWYSATILLILGCHELGHYVACRYYDVDASLPYFIPAPLALTGTLGAFIRIREPIPSKRMLFDIGIAGPIAGFVIAVPALIFGLLLSRVVQMPEDFTGFSFGEPLLFRAASYVIWGAQEEGQAISLHPMGFAAWFGLLATALNLFPIGQLDGGHISYAVFGRRSSHVTLATVAVAFVLSWFSTSWVVWTVLMVVMLILFGRHHPRTADEHIPLDRPRQVLAAVALAMFVVCFTPVPIEPLIGASRPEPLENAQRIDVDDAATGDVGMSDQAALDRFPHLSAVRALEQDLSAVLPTQPGERRGRWTEHDESSPGFAADGIGEGLRAVHGARRRGVPNDHVHQRGKGRVAHRLPERSLTLGKRGEILTAPALDAVVVRIERLHDRFPRPIAASRPAGHLREKLERPLGRAKVSHAEPHIR